MLTWVQLEAKASGFFRFVVFGCAFVDNIHAICGAACSPFLFIDHERVVTPNNRHVSECVLFAVEERDGRHTAEGATGGFDVKL